MVGSFSLSRCRQNLKFGDFTLLFCGVRHRNAWKLDLHVGSSSIFPFLKAWLNARNISTAQHLATLLHDVATCVERGGQTHATCQCSLCPRTLARKKWT